VPNQAGSLEERAGENDPGDGEIDDEAGDVDKCGDEGSGGAGGIKATLAEDAGEHGAGESAEGDDTEQAESDGEGDQEVVFTIGVPERLPDQNAREADDAENGAEHHAGGNFAADDAPPVLEADLAEGKGADDERMVALTLLQTGIFI
jgi:hypothetical protein